MVTYSSYSKISSWPKGTRGSLTCGFLLWQSLRERDASLDAANRQVLANARSLAEHTYQSLAEVDRIIAGVAAAIGQKGGIQSWQEQSLHKFLQQQTRGLRQIGTILVANAAGQSVATAANFPQKPISVTDRDYYRHHRSASGSTLHLGRPVLSKVLGLMIFTISRPLIRPDGSFDGVVVVSFPLDYFDNFYQSIATRPDLQAALVRTDGWLLMASPHDDRAYQVNISGKELLNTRLNQSPSGVFHNRQSGYDEQERQVGYARVGAPYNELIAVVTVSRESVLKGWQHSLVMNVSAALLLLAVCLALGILLVKRLHDLEVTEEALRKSESHFRSIFERANTGIAFADLHGELLQCNLNFADLLESTPEQLRGKHFASFTCPEDAVIEQELYQQVMEGRRDDYRLEKRYLTSTGRTVWVDLSVAAIRDMDGKPVNFVGLVVDITERKEAESKLSHAKQAAETANLAKSRFLAIVSHEIRTPMNAIQGMAHLLQQTPLDVRQAEYLESISEASGSLSAIINDILDISKIEAGKMQLEQTALDLQHVLGSSLALLRIKAEQKGLRLTLEADPNLPGRLLGDPFRLGQILNNLLGNAIKFTEQGWILLRVTEQGRHGTTVVIRFEVADSGIGIPQEYQAGLFQPFTQADTSIARRFGGTGLGLSISSELVHLMGGELRFASESGKGSTFAFTIPFSLLLDEPAVDRPAERVAVTRNRQRTAAAAAKPATAAELASLVSELGLLLEKQNMVALRHFEQLQQRLSGTVDDELQELHNRIRRLEFAEAARLLRRLAEKLGIP
ncbi:MAG: PAS domain S-box protein [Geobacter sp.]|nr:PAS domain S-box protein [Geobacter sp.]